MEKFLSIRFACALVVAFTSAAASVEADDKWEAGGTGICVDDDAVNCNSLIHGQPQTHDLQGAPGADKTRPVGGSMFGEPGTPRPPGRGGRQWTGWPGVATKR